MLRLYKVFICNTTRENDDLGLCGIMKGRMHKPKFWKKSLSFAI